MDPDQKTPVDADTLFELGSMSKDFPHAAAKVLEYQDSNQICLYIVANPRYRESGLRALLADKLLAYMIPQFILRLEESPRYSNGKTDKARLPVPDASISAPAVSTDTKHLPVLLDALQTYIEESDITASSNYYALGRDSIKAIQISSKLNEQGYLLSVKEILQNPVIADMASYIKEAKQTALSENDCSGFIERMLFRIKDENPEICSVHSSRETE